jgi:nitrogenase-stabilizing/protective protein
MGMIMQALSQLSSAEEFMEFFGVQFDQRVLNVNRLHILKRFNQYISRHEFASSDEVALKSEYRALLEKAYTDFVASDAVTEKVFKVFQEAAGVKTFSIDSLRANLPGRKVSQAGNT